MEQDKESQEQLWQLIVHCDMSGKSGYLQPFPIYHQSQGESLFESAIRFLEIIRLCDPDLLQAPINGYNALYFIGVQVGMILTALGLPASEAMSLLQAPETWTNRFNQALSLHPEVEPAVIFFQKDYTQWSRDKRSSRTEAFKTKLLPFLLDPALKALCCSPTPGIDWHDVEKKRKAVILDFRDVNDMDRKRFLSLWTLKSFQTYIKQRHAGIEKVMWALILDELKYFFSVTDDEEGDKAFAKELIELNDVYARNYNIAPVYITQDLNSFGERTQQSLLSIGTQIIGPVHNHAAAMMLSEALFSRNTKEIKHLQPVYVMMDDFTHATFIGRSLYVPKIPVVIDYEPTFYQLDELVHIDGETIKYLKNGQFLVRPAFSTGISSKVYQVNVKNMDKGLWPIPAVCTKIRSLLTKKCGTPLEILLTDIKKHQLTIHTRKELPGSATLPPHEPPKEAPKRRTLPLTDPETDDY